MVFCLKIGSAEVSIDRLGRGFSAFIRIPWVAEVHLCRLPQFPAGLHVHREQANFTIRVGRTDIILDVLAMRPAPVPQTA